MDHLRKRRVSKEESMEIPETTEAKGVPPPRPAPRKYKLETKKGGRKAQRRKAAVEVITGCGVCNQDHENTTSLLCDGCDQEYHLNCVDPPLRKVPTADFFCASCANEMSNSSHLGNGEYLLLGSDDIQISPPAYEDTRSDENVDPSPPPPPPLSHSSMEEKESEPSRPSLPKTRTTNHRGIEYRNRQRNWLVSLTMPGGEERIVGTYTNEEMAARCYDAAAFREYGESAILNYPPFSEAAHAKLEKEHYEKQKRNKNKKSKAAKRKANFVENGEVPDKRKYRGVSSSNGGVRCQVSLYHKGRNIYMGTYPTALEAARAYDQAAMHYGLSTEYLNFPENEAIYRENLKKNGAPYESNATPRTVVPEVVVPDPQLVSQAGQLKQANSWMTQFNQFQRLLDAAARFLHQDGGLSVVSQELSDIVMSFVQDGQMNVDRITSKTKGSHTAIYVRFLPYEMRDPILVDLYCAFISQLCRVMDINVEDVSHMQALLKRICKVNTIIGRTKMASDPSLRTVNAISEPKTLYSQFIRGVDANGKAQCQVAICNESAKSCTSMALRDGSYVTQSLDEIKTAAISDTEAVNLLWNEMAPEGSADPNYVELMTLYNTHVNYLQKTCDASGIKIDANLTDLMAAIAHFNVLSEGMGKVKADLKERENQANAAKDEAVRDEQFLDSFHIYMENNSNRLRTKAERSLKISISKSSDRAATLATEAAYYESALEQLDPCNILEGSYIEYYSKELDIIWSERSETMETMNMLERYMKPGVSEELNACTVSTRESIMHDIYSCRSLWIKISCPIPKDKIIRVKSETMVQEPIYVSLKKEVDVIIEPTAWGTAFKTWTTSVLYHPGCIEHRTPDGHPECPERLDRAMDVLTGLGRKHPGKLKLEGLKQSVDAIRPDESTLLLVHSPSYLEHLRTRSFEAKGQSDTALVFESHTERGSSTVQSDHVSGINTEAARAYNAVTGTSGPMDTYVCADSWDVALLAAGTVCLGVDRVLKGECSNAVCLVRPPGHHVGRDGRTSAAPSSGFCLLNNVIVGAMHARRYPGIRKVAVLDWDIHHGNGTEELMRGDDESFFASIHLFSQCFFPGTGNDCNEQNIVNVALRNSGIGSGSTAFRQGMTNQILPAMEAFVPDIIFISAGFDGHKDDIIGGMAAIKNTHVPAGYTEEDYVWATERVLEMAHRLCSGRVVSVLEGGYDIRQETNSLAKSIEAHIDAMVVGYTEPASEENEEENDALENNEKKEDQVMVSSPIPTPSSSIN